MFRLGSKGITRRSRRLWVEGLENRWMLAGDTLEAPLDVEAQDSDVAVTATDADWSGSLTTDLGEVEYVELSGAEPIQETLWCRFDTMHDGYVTVVLEDLDSTSSGLAMTLHRQDGDGNLEEIDTGTTRVDNAAAMAGERYFVQITGLRSTATVRVSNQVQIGADTLTIHGSNESDELVLDIGDSFLVTINRIDYDLTFPDAALVTTTFDGDDGDDQIRVLGGDGDDTANLDLASQSGTVAGPGFAVEFSSTSLMEFDGREGHDTAEISGTDADSEVQLEPFKGALLESAVQGSVLGAEEIVIDAAGGDDHVVFEGGTEDDRLDLNPTSGQYSEYVPSEEVRDPTFIISVDNIESNMARSGGGEDRVFMWDSEGDETFTADRDVVTYEGPGYEHEIHGFSEVHAYGLNGGVDTATIFDSAGNDKFKGTETYSIMRGGGYVFRAKGFETVEATSLYGGQDYAVLYDTDGDDVLTASYESATVVTAESLTWQATGFERVLGRASGGFDVAHLEDSPNRDEFRGRSHKATFRSRDDDSYDLTVRAFDEVYATAVHGGDDIGKMHDEPLDDHLDASENSARLYQVSKGSLDLLYEVTAFETVKTYWTTGSDTKELSQSTNFVYNEVAGSTEVVRVEKDVTYLDPVRAEKADLYLPEFEEGKTYPGIVIIHGGGWVAGDKAQSRELNIGTTLASNGYVCISINYALATPGNPTFPQNIQDCKQAVRWLRENADWLHLDAEHIGAIGGSAGGHLTALLAVSGPEVGLDPETDSEYSCRIQAAVPMYPHCASSWEGRVPAEPYPTLTMFAESHAAAPELWDSALPINHLSEDDPPMLILHGTADKTTPLDQSTRFHEAALEAGVQSELVIIEGAPHSFHLQPTQQDLRPVVLEFLDKYLKPNG